MDRHACKRNRALTCSFFAILAFIFSLVSCDNFNKPVREYFDYYTNTAGIGEMAVPESIGTWNGMPVIESDSDKEIIFYLRNPKNYTLLTECAYSDSNMPRGVIAQDTADKSRIKMLLEANDLVTYEESYPDDKIISGIITLQVDDGRPPFDGFFSFSILVNSAPPPIRGVTLQLSQNNSGTYILCFYAPKTNGTVHIDTKKIYINNECYDFGTDGKPVNRTGITSSDPQFITITNPSTQLFPLRNTNLKFSENAPANYAACYYDTKIPADYSGQMNYTVSLKDDYGFESTERITNSIRILKNPVINVTTGIYNADPDSKKYTVRISHDGKDTSGNSIGGNATVYYTVAETSGLTPFEGSSTLEGSASGTADIQLTKGTYTITTYASKLDFIESDTVTAANVVIKEPAVFYVDGSNGEDNEAGYDGSLNKPFKTINRALTAFRTALTADNSIIKCTIYLKSDITVERADYQYHLLELNNFSGKTIELAGKTNKKIIDTTGYMPEGNPGDVMLIKVNQGNSLILNNIEIKNYEVEFGPVIENYGTLTLDNSSIVDCPWVTCAISNEGNIIFKGTVNVKNNKFVRTYSDDENNIIAIERDVNVTLHDGSTIDVSELSSGSKIGIGVGNDTAPIIGTPTLIATGFPSGLHPWNIFTSDENDYFIDYDSEDHTKVMLKKAGSSIEIGGFDNLTVDVTSSTGTVNFKAHEGQFTALTVENLKCGFDTVPEAEYDAVLKEDGTIEVTVSSLQPGSYVLNATVVYNGSTHLLNLPFTK